MKAQSVLDELKAQAERKAALKMFYSAAEVLREYRGPFAQETAEERNRLADYYEDLGRAAERARWGEDAAPPPRQPVPELTAAAPKAAPPPHPATRAPKPPAEKPATPRPSLLVSKPTAEVQASGDQLTFACRWCKEPITTAVANAGKLIPCPKCDLLVTVPKPAPPRKSK